MPVAASSAAVTKIYNGTTPISRVYSGTNLVFDTAAPAPVLAGLKPTSKTQAQQDSSVHALWTNWKTSYLRQNTTNGWYAVRADAQGGLNPYVAEGQGYGMMLAAQMGPYDTNARTIFDGITKYVLDHPSAIDGDLHAAEQDANMVTHNGGDSATDGDMDIAMGLLMAHHRWGSTGTHNYLEIARTKIAAIKRSLISPVTGLLELGDWSADYTASGGEDWRNVSRPSDWMIGHFEAFKRATSDTAWDAILDRHMDATERLQSVYAVSTGLVPDFTIGGTTDIYPAPPNTLEGEHDGHYYYNACRVPWRLGVASSTSSRLAAARIGAWAKTKSGGVPANMPTGYHLDGTTIGAYPDIAFIAPFAVGAAAGDDQTWLNSLWDYIAASTTAKNYYSDSIQLLCMIYLSRTYYIDPLAAETAVDASVRSVSAASIAYTTATKTIAKPAGTIAGDILLLAMHCDFGAIADFKLPSGFTTLNTRDSGADDKQIIGYKVAGSAEPASYTMTVPTDADLRADLLCITGADTAQAPRIATAATGSSASSHAAPSVTPGSNRGLLVSTASMSATAGGVTFTWAPPSGMTERSDATANGYVTMTTATQTWNSSSATGTRTFSLSTTSAAAPAMTASVVVPSGTAGGGDGTAGTGYAPKSSLAAGTTATGDYSTVRRGVTYTGGGTSSVYHIDPTAASASTPAPVVIHLHGDGYQEYTNYSNGVTTSVAYDYMDVAKAHGAIGVIPRTPDTASATWWTLDTPRTWLAALITDLKARYNIDTKRMFLSGFSGGSEHITYNMIVDHHSLFEGGGTMILGGGGASSTLAFTGTPTAALKSQFPMRWFVGENDVAGATQPSTWSAREAAASGEAFYKAAGFETSITLIPGKAHNDSEPYGPYYLNTVMNEINEQYGITEVAAPSGADVPPASSETTPDPTPVGYQSVGSNGSGGSWTNTTSTTYRTWSDGTVSSRYRFYGSHVPDKTKAVPLVIHFHGDGAWEYNNPETWTSAAYMQIARDVGGIGIIPKTPNSDNTWWSTASSGNWAGNLIRELMKKYNIDKRRIYLSGFSGGSVMITTTLMNRYHQDYLGGAAKMLGGGGQGTQVGTYTAQLKRDFPMRWHVGTLDDGRNTSDGYNARLYAERSEADYKSRGFNTAMVYIQGEDHGQSQDDGPAALRSTINLSHGIYGLPKI